MAPSDWLKRKAMIELGFDSLVLPVLAHSDFFLLWLVSISDEGSLPNYRYQMYLNKHMRCIHLTNTNVHML